MTNVAPGAGGVERPPATLASHRFSGSEPAFLKRHLKLSLKVTEDARELAVTATVAAHGVGHKSPTGHPSRALVLWVEAVDAEGRPLTRLAGPTLPPLAGQGDAAQGGWPDSRASCIKKFWRLLTAASRRRIGVSAAWPMTRGCLPTAPTASVFSLNAQPPRRGSARH